LKKILALIGFLLLFGMAVHTIEVNENIFSNLYLLVWVQETNVTYGDNIEAIWCLPESMYTKNVTVEGQTDTNPAFIVNNFGHYNMSGVTGWLSVNTQSGFNFKCDSDNDPTGAVVLNTTHQTLYTGTIEAESFVNVWCWCDFDNPTDYYEGEIDFTLV
jgi:hypothetical protein